MSNQPNTLSKEIINKIKEYYKSHTKIETAEKFGVSPTSVTKYCPKKTTPLTPEQKAKRKIEKVTRRRRKVKKLLVEYKGGKCIKCGYDKCVAALEFHHRNPEEKEFGISSGNFTKALATLKKEVNKCDLICANCHREEHWYLGE